MLSILKVRILPLCWALLSLFFSFPANSNQGESAEALLAKMANASRNLNYSGTFTYEDGAGSVESLAISHTVERGIEIESIAHLNGPQRVFSLPTKVAGCESVGSRLLMTGAGVFKSNPNYEYSLSGRNRVSGRIVDVLRVIPKDQLRYGFTLGLDSETGLMLLAVVRTPKRILERVQFTSLNLNVGEGGKGDQTPSDAAPPCEVSVVASKSPLKPNWVPEGFTLAAYTYSEKSGHVETYTDGLVSFSITAQTQIAQVGEALQGEAQRGATVIQLALVAVGSSPVQITVVGEIPPATANRILRSVRPKG